MSDVLYTLRETLMLFSVEGIYTVYDTCFDKDYNYKGEVHNFWELVYVKDGHIGITAHNKIFELQKGQIVFHKPGEFHSIWSTRGSSPKVFILSFSLDRKLPELEDMLCSLSPSAQIHLNLLMQTTIELTTKFDQVTRSNHLHTTKTPSYALDHRIKNYLELLIIELISQKSYTLETTMSPIKLESYDKVISYIHSHLFTQINIDSLCSYCNISRSTLKSLFKKYVGIGAMEYVNKMKIYKAMELLDEGYSSQEIADKLAFSSPYYFSSVFKKITGLTPTDYKKH